MLKTHTAAIAKEFHSVFPDLFVIAENRDLAQFLNAAKGSTIREEALANLQDTFRRFAGSKGHYSRISLLDEGGEPVAEVNYDRGMAYVVVDSIHQPKKKYNYFSEISSLEEGEVYVSPMEFEVGDGEKEKPSASVIHFGIPVFDAGGERKGALLLSFMGERILSSLEKAGEESDGEIILLDRNGETIYRVGPRETGDAPLLPEEMKKILSGDTGQFVTANGLFSWYTVSPLLEGMWTGPAGGEEGRDGGKMLRGTEYTWKLLSIVEPSRLNEGVRPLLWGIFGLYALLLAIAGAGTYLVDRLSHQKVSIWAMGMPPAYLIFILAVSAFVAELFVMMLISFLPPMSPSMEALADSSVLVVMLTPLLYLLLFRPLIMHLESRSLAEAALVSAEKKTRSIIKAVGEGVIVAGEDSRIRFVNEELCRIFGYKEDELFGHNVEMLMPEKYRLAHRTAMSRYLEKSEGRILGKRLELEGMRKDGKIFPLELRIEETMGGEEEGRLFTAAIRDITNRKAADLEIKSSHARLQSILDNSTAIIYLKNIEGRYILVNRRFELVFGMKRDEVLGKTDYDIFDSRTAEMLLKNDRQVLFNRVPKEFEETMPSRGETRTYLSVKFAVFDVAGSAYALCGMSTDITSRKLEEEQLRLTQFSIDHSSDMAFWMGADARFLYVNEAMADSLGYTREELLSMRVHDIDPDITEERWKAHLRNLKKMGSLNFENMARAKNGRTFPVEVTMWYMEFKGKEFNCAFMHDITERKKAENEFREAKEKAEEATRLKDKFVSIVSHDLKGPIGAIVNYLNLIRVDSDNVLPEKTLKVIDLMIESGDRMLALTKELLNISRIKAGVVKLRKSFLDAHTIASRAVWQHKPEAGKKGIAVRNAIPPRTRIYADPTMFAEVLDNLVSNAVKFCSEGDVITIYIPEGDQSSIAISDTGPGINPELMEHLFKYEVRTTTKGTAGEQGTGLGLPFSMDIMEAHGGALNVESVPGKGTVFCATLPRVNAVALVVESGKGPRERVKRMLKELNIEAVEISTGEEALEYVRNTPPHLVILGLSAEGDELSARRELKMRAKERNIPVIALAEDTHEKVMEKFGWMSAMDIVVNPGKPDRLLDILIKILG